MPWQEYSPQDQMCHRGQRLAEALGVGRHFLFLYVFLSAASVYRCLSLSFGIAAPLAVARA